MFLKWWTKKQISLMGFDLRSDKEALLDAIKQMPDDIDVVVGRYGDDVLRSPRYGHLPTENGQIIICPRNRKEEE